MTQSPVLTDPPSATPSVRTVIFRVTVTLLVLCLSFLAFSDDGGYTQAEVDYAWDKGYTQAKREELQVQARPAPEQRPALDGICEEAQSELITSTTPVLVVDETCYLGDQIAKKLVEVDQEQAKRAMLIEPTRQAIILEAEQSGIKTDQSWRRHASFFAFNSELPHAFDAALAVYMEHGGSPVDFEMEVMVHGIVAEESMQNSDIKFYDPTP